MRVRTLFAITLTMFALPAIAAEMPTAPQPRAVPAAAPQMLPPIDANGNPDVSVVFGVCILKMPVGFCERAGIKLPGGAVLTDDNMRRLLEAAQASPETSAMQFPKITAEDGQTATVRNCEQRLFVTGIDATKVKGATVLVPKNTSVELGDTLTVCGQVARDAQTVTVKMSLTRVRVAGSMELIPVTTQITPVFEGGSQGKPVPFTQFIQVPDIKTEKVEKNVVLPADGTIVLGSWKETVEVPAEQPKRHKLLPRKEKPTTEYEVVAFATVRVLRNEELAVAPMPRELSPARVTKVFEVLDLVVPGKLPPGRDSSAEYRKNTDNLVKLVMQTVRPASWVETGGRGQIEYFDIGCALVVTNTPDVVEEVANLLETLRRLNTPCAVAPMPREAGKVRAFQLRNIAAADAAHALTTHLKDKNLEVRITFDAPTNTVFVQADPALGQRICAMLAALDKAPPQVMMQAMVIQVPRGFMETCGLTTGGDPSTKPCVLSPRETRMLTALLRAAREKGELDVLSRPQICVNDNQTGFVQVGQSYPVPTTGLVKTAGGWVVVESKIELVPTGFSMRLTPRVSPDGSVLLRTEGQLTTVAPSPATPGNPEDPKSVQMPAFNTQQVSSTTEVRDGDTLVVAMVGGETGGRSFIGTIRRCCTTDKLETFVIITPHIIAPAKPVRPAAGEGQK